MLKLYSPRRQKQIACVLLSTIGAQILLPSTAYALTGGPSQPEFSSFEPVSTSQMVDEFTGDFTYNLPILNVPGPAGSDYPLSLSYHSGASSEEEASWVGYGWTLNPGAITRNTRGFPDDYSGADVTYWNKAPKNWTATVGVGKGVEIFGKDFNASAALRYNNYMGYGYNVGVGIPLGKGIASLGYNISDGKGSFSASVNPGALLMRTQAHSKENENKIKSRYKIGRYTASPNDKYKPASSTNLSTIGGNFGILSYADAVRPNHASAYSGAAFNISANLQINPAPAPVGITVNVNGSYSYQTNEERKVAPAYGYLYTDNLYNGAASTTGKRANSEAVEDYYLEKDTPYNQRDTYLGIPFNNADQFSVTGEGIGGSCRLYHERVGEFTPNAVASNVIIGNLSPEVSVGLTFGVGVDGGAGLQRLTEGPWKEQTLRFSKPNDGKENAYFRFTNDLGGEWAAPGVIDAATAPYVNRQGPDLNTNGYRNDLAYPSTRKGRSSYIAYHTKRDVYGTNNIKVAGSSFSHRSDASVPVTAQLLRPESICEMSVVSAAGTRYVYGLPLLNKAEKNLNYGMTKEPAANIRSNYLISTNKSDEEMSAINGEERDIPYAGSFLLTETRTPDYTDRTFDGPTPDDFGGYTRFNYTKQYGGNGAWYNWRTPYAGLLYQANSLSDAMDDMGTMSCGQKEIAMLHSVQTKTHTAIFFLRKSASRADGIGAEDVANYKGARTPAFLTNPTPTRRDTLSCLDKINLYSNEDITIDASGYPHAKQGAKPIKTVRFEYFDPADPATLCANLPNALPNGSRRMGKLTLKRVWYEYQGIQTKISPYTFSYTYPTSAEYNLYPAKYRARPNDLTIGYRNLTAAQQNPDYSYFNLDAWGNYQTDGATRYANQQSWLDQKETGFDPAAWQLKVITLPTGGQIQVQYEQDDYAYVQDKPAHVMVPLVMSQTNQESDFTLNLGEIGLTSQDEVMATKAAIEREYINPTKPGRKMYFKFLYSLIGSDPPSLNPIACNSEYITGYTAIKSVDYDQTTNQLKLNLFNRNGDYQLPKQVCQNFAKTQRNGKLNPAGVCDPSVNGLSDQGLGPAGLMYFILQRFGSIVGLTNSCAKLAPQHSYFRIPVVKAKKGGGLRVKRLLTFDTGFDNQPVLYGSEYIYKSWDRTLGRLISSGVATTEPGGQREENILVDFMPREHQNLWSKIVAGEDLKQAESPLGESLLPAPQVGYSRVVVRNIHSGRTTTGYSVSEFATVRQYPMQVKSTDLRPDKEYRILTAGLVTDLVNNLYAGQGFSFILNNMHGQVLRKATYPGDYTGEVAEGNAAPSSQQIYTYYQPGEDVAVTSAVGTSVPAHPGREVDVTIAQRLIKDTSYDLSAEFDADIVFLFLFTLGFATVVPTLSRSTAEFGTHVTTKVVRYPAIVKTVETLQDGIVHTSTNKVFDQYTGQPVLVQNTDEFEGGYLQQSQMASWMYPELSAKAVSEGLTLTTSTAGAMVVTTQGQKSYLNFSGSACEHLAKLTQRDLVRLTGTSPAFAGTVFHLDKPDFFANRVRIYPVVFPTAGQTFQSANSIIPNNLAGTVNSLFVLNSGRTNQLGTVAGSTTYHNSSLTALAPPAIVTPTYTNNSFTTALNNLPAATATATSTTLGSTFTNMNVSAFSNLINPVWGVNPANATIQKVKVTVIIADNGQRQILIEQFELVLPDGSTQLIKN